MVRFSSSPLAGGLVCILAASSLVGCQSSTSNSPSAEGSPAASATPVTTIFPDTFAQVCNGVPLEPAAAYTKTAGETHPILVFKQEEANSAFSKAYPQLPEGWELDWQESEKTQLVACVKTTARTPAETCEFKADKEGGKPYQLELYDATYEVSIYAAQTGERLETKTMNLKAGDCPMFHMFTEGELTDTRDANYDQPLLEFVKPYVLPAA